MRVMPVAAVPRLSVTASRTTQPGPRVRWVRSPRYFKSCGAFVGTAPHDLKYRGERTHLTLGPGCVVREAVTLNRGTAATGMTRIGARCLFMAYSHIAHD